MPEPRYAGSDTLEAAQAWRAEHGGWIFASAAGPAVWFCLRFTPTPILRHPLTRALGDGQLL